MYKREAGPASLIMSSVYVCGVCKGLYALSKSLEHANFGKSHIGHESA